MAALLDRLLGRNDDAEPAGVDLPLDDLLHLLRVERRRETVRLLIEDFDGEAQLRDLAGIIAAIELGRPDADHVDSQERKRVYVAMYQEHLPKLAKHGVAQWTRGGTIKATPTTADVYQVLAEIEAAVRGEQ